MNDLTNDVVKQSRTLLEGAYSRGASDIHFIPRTTDTLVEIRTSGSLEEMAVLSRDLAVRIINHFKFLSGMTIGRSRVPQNGSMQVAIHHHDVSLRMSTLPTPYHESLAIRLLPQKQDLSVDDLSVFKEATGKLTNLLNYDSGLIIISGPTGSGKTTTLYTMLDTLQKRDHVRVITIEDPIEKKNPDFIQMEVNEAANVTYATGFKAILRHDPDIIMIGEIRDEETAKIAVRASLTGHLVLSTVHASDAIMTIRRLTELGISRFDLRETLAGVVAERLVLMRDASCGSDGTHSGHLKRTGVFEILMGLSLHRLLADPSRSRRLPDFKTIEDYIREGTTQGLICEHLSKGRERTDLHARAVAPERPGRSSDHDRQLSEGRLHTV